MSRIYQVKFLGKSRDDVDFTLVFNGPSSATSNKKEKENKKNVYYTDTFIYIDDTV